MRMMEYRIGGLLVDVRSFRFRRNPRSSQVGVRIESATWHNWPAYEIGSNPALEEELAIGRRA